MHGTTERMEFRMLRRSDVPAYLKVVLLGVGKLERSTGLDRTAGAMFRLLSRRSTWILLDLMRLVGRAPVEILIARDGDRIVGTGMVLRFPKAMYVAGMVTDPEFRGRGVASRILALLRETAERRHRVWLVLDVDSDNDPAIGVYRRAGYHEAVRFSWYVRAGVPPTSSATGARAALATHAELRALLPALNGARSPEYRSALPASVRMLSHSEFLIAGKGVRRETWLRRSSSGSALVVRACFSPEASIGMYLPMGDSTPPTPEEVAGLFDPGTEWLRPHEPATCVAVVAEPPGAIGAALEGLGFARVSSSVTMIRSSAA